MTENSHSDRFFPDETALATDQRQVEEAQETFGGDDFYGDEGIFGASFGTSFPTSVSNFHRRARKKRELRRLSNEFADHIQSGSSQDRLAVTRASHSSLSLPSAISSASSDDVREDAEVYRARRQSVQSKRSKRRTMRRKSTDNYDSTSIASSRKSSASRVSIAAQLRGRSASSAKQPSSDEGEDGIQSETESEQDSQDSLSDYGPFGSPSSGSSAASEHERRNHTASGLFISHGLLGTTDPFFGDTRVDFTAEENGPLSEWQDDKRFANLTEEQLSQTRQGVYLADEDLQLLFLGWRSTILKSALWSATCVLSVGVAPLLARWFPNFWLRGRGQFCTFEDASHIIVQSSNEDIYIVKVADHRLTHAVAANSVFPATMCIPSENRTAFHENKRNRAGEEKAKNVDGLVDNIRSMDFRHYRFLLHPSRKQWYMLRDWRDPTWTTVRFLRNGITQTVYELRRTLFGHNVIGIQIKPVLQLLLDECLHPFYCFQIASIVLWSLDDYMFYAATIAIISIISIISTLIETRRNTNRMVEMSRFSCPVHVQRDHTWKVLPSEDLVPGDVVDLAHDELTSFPADILMLSGDSIVNESMLTGESVPVSKTPVEDIDIPAILLPGELAESLSKHIVFNGTRIIRVRRTDTAWGQPEAVGVVLRTGFNTTKGALVRSMLFPRPLGFRFIGILSLIAAIGFLGSVAKFIEFGISWDTILKRALDLITITCPPALPATMSIGTSFAISRLRNLSIFCISPNRVNVGGKIDAWVFDKTGTLTEEGLDVLGVRSVDRSVDAFTDLYTDVEDVPIVGSIDAKTPLIHALATCHALKLVDGELVGDPLDLRMFDFTRWTLQEGSDKGVPVHDKTSKPLNSRLPDRPSTLVQTVVRPPGGLDFNVADALKSGTKHAHFLELGIIRTFDFVSSLRRMAVMTKKLKSKSIEIYVKGAPEALVEICDRSTLPLDFHEMLNSYTKHGFRVIAFAGRSMPGLTWIKAQRMKREQVETDLRFLGLIVFENRLKQPTAPTIHTLLHARIEARMCTGDNIRTAVSVARECGMVREGARVYIPEFRTGKLDDSKAELQWTDVDDESDLLNPYTLEPLPTSDDESAVAERDWAIAVSGEAFRWLVDFAALETLQRMLVKSTIFARMSPDEKHELVERLQSLGYTVGFCGDGANDCGALKAADVGLSLSEAEASVAAPFTSRLTDISCTLEVIREGRAALVTSFSCFKALYSLIQFTSVTLLYSIASSLGDFQFLYIDLFIILPIAVTMGRARPFPKIHTKRPTANLVSKQVLMSLAGQVILTSGFQLLVFYHVRRQDWYIAPKINPVKLKIKNYENTALFLISSFQYIFIAAVFCAGPPYRQPIHNNLSFLLVLSCLSTFSLYTLFASTGPVFKLLQLIRFPREFHLELTLLVLLNIALCYMWEKHIVAPASKAWGRILKRIRRLRGKGSKSQSGKLYKAIR